jgi:RNA polymerase-interacting CarD/CdnL/TRCF family regulator
VLAIDVACLAGHYALWIALPMLWFGPLSVLVLYAGLWATGGLLLALVFAPAHIGLPVLAQDQRGGWEQQLDTTRNLTMPAWLSWFFMGLDYQVEHHLFPRIPHQNLERASRIVGPWCERVGARYNRVDYTSSLRHVTRHVRWSWQADPEVVVDKTKARKLDRLSVGSRVFHPEHGVVSVSAVEEHELGDGKRIFYILELEIDRGGRLLLPATKVSEAGIRELISRAKARELLKTVAEERGPSDIKTDPASRKLRATSYGEALRSGSADRYTEILCELLPRARARTLSAGEQQILDRALALFVGEMSAALDRSPEEVKADLVSIATPPAIR